MARLQCSGWWEQTGFGRQPMKDLQISFSNGRIFGQGTDIVGDFELDGSIDQEMIYLCKQYIGQHRIDYHGTSIGEGAYTGKWSCYGIPGGNWFIGIIRSADTTEALTHDVQEIRN